MNLSIWAFKKQQILGDLQLEIARSIDTAVILAP